MIDTNYILSNIKGGLIVSCQALKHEPLHSSFIMSKMAYAAKIGGAVAIRANSYDDIVEIKKNVDIPVLGIVKRDYEDSQIYITPTMKEIEELVSAKADVIALDATNRKRPGGMDLEEFVQQIRKEHKDLLLMADISTYEEGVEAYRLGFDIVSTTLSGYTEYSKRSEEPDFKLLKRLTNDLDIPIIAEGRIWTPEQAKIALELGAFAVVVGTAITRPKEITERFVKKIKSVNC